MCNIISAIKCRCICSQWTAGHLGVWLWGPRRAMPLGSLSQCLITCSRLVAYDRSFLKVKSQHCFVLAIFFFWPCLQWCQFLFWIFTKWTYKIKLAVWMFIETQKCRSNLGTFKLFVFFSVVCVCFVYSGTVIAVPTTLSWASCQLDHVCVCVCFWL